MVLRTFATTQEIRDKVRELFAGLLEKYPGWTFATLKRLTLRQVVDILLRPRPETQGALPQASGNGHAGAAVTAEAGPPSLEKELKDLEKVKMVLGAGLAQESYEKAKAKIHKKYESRQPDQQPPGETGRDT